MLFSDKENLIHVLGLNGLGLSGLTYIQPEFVNFSAQKLIYKNQPNW